MAHRKIRCQRRIPGVTRVPTSSALLPETERIIEQEARTHDVARSFVRATALNDYFGVKGQERYDEPVKRGRLTGNHSKRSRE